MVGSADTSRPLAATLGRLSRLVDESLLPQSPEVAIGVQLALLLAFLEVSAVSLSTRSPEADVNKVGPAGELVLAGEQTTPATEALLGDPRDQHAQIDSELGIRLDRWSDQPAALIAHGAPRRGDHRLLLLE